MLPIAVFIIFVFGILYIVAHNYDKRKKRIKEHMKNGDIITNQYQNHPEWIYRYQTKKK